MVERRNASGNYVGNCVMTPGATFSVPVAFNVCEADRVALRGGWLCPKDGTAMQPHGRRSGAWRCPTCKGMFIDTGAMRRGRPPKWSPILTSILMSLLARAVVRRMRRRSNKESSS
jgi:Transcription factor zinc-finger